MLNALVDYIETCRAILRTDPAARSLLEVLVCYPGPKAVLMHRLCFWLYESKFYILARLLSQHTRFWTGIEIHPGAKLGQRVFIDHGAGVVIGETAEIGDDCLLYHGVTLGGVSRKQIKHHPTLGRGVIVGAGATILGPVNIGDGARIAAGAVIIENIPEGRTVPLSNTKTDVSRLE